MNRARLFTLIFFVVMVLAFYFKSTLYLDPDLGWQLKTGEFIVKNGVPRTDPFSYTMPHFPVVAHSWMSDVIFYKTHEAAGIDGIAIITSIALAATVMVVCGAAWLGWMYVPAILMAAHFYPYAGTRPQTFSWLFFALLMRVLLDKKAGFTFGRYLPILFFVWAQVHGGFFIGLILLAIWAAFDLKKRLFIAVLATGATLINPYGFALWREILTTFLSLTTHASVNEWSPTFTQLDLRLGLVILLPTFLITRFPRVYSQFFRITYFLLLFLMLSSSKMFPFWLIVAGYAIIQGFGELQARIIDKKGGQNRLNFFVYILLLVVAINSIILTTATINTYKTLREDVYYPKKAVVYLKNNLPQGNIFAPFGWGGYLVWHLPEKKVFISGQMPHWGNLLDEYSKIVSLQSPFEKTAATYNISTVLVQKSKTNFAEFARELKKNGWQMVYEDDVAQILRRP